MLSRSLIYLLLTVLSAASQAGPDAVRVVASIAPVHSLLAGIMEGVAEPGLLVPASLSPHDYQLRPSQAVQLQQAGVVVRVGPALELFLNRIWSQLPESVLKVELMNTPGLRLLQGRGGGIWGSHEHHHHGDGGPGLDPHIWLDPRNAQEMVAYLAARLSARYPAHADRFTANAGHLRQRLQDLDTELDRRLRPLRDRPFLMLHDGFQYLEHRYGLSGRGSLMVNPAVSTGARRLSAVIRAIREQDIACLFSEPQLPRAQVQMLRRDTGVRIGQLDPLGKDLQPGPDAYFELLRANARAIESCLLDQAEAASP